MVEARKMGKYTPVTTAEAIRDSSNNREERNTAFKEAQLIVGTPGTVLDLIKRRIIEKKHIKIFVLDEADNMLNQQGLGDQSIKVKKYVYYFYAFAIIIYMYYINNELQSLTAYCIHYILL